MRSEDSMSFIEFDDVEKVYHTGELEIEALRGVSFSIEKGEIAVILGESGAGKTTLLNILGGMDRLTSGSVRLDGQTISDFSGRQLTHYRRHDVGFVFQFYNLIPNLTAQENVSMATQLCNNSLDSAEVLASVGLSERLDNFPSQLSGGEQQRVAIARALAKKPKLLLCDEPTGALDYMTGKSILKLLQDTGRKNDMTIVIITHNQAITAMANRIIKVRAGKVTDSYINPHVTPVEEIEW